MTRWYRILVSSLVLLLLLGSLPAPVAGHRPSFNPARETGGQVVEIPYTSPAQLAQLAAQLDIWEVHHDAGYVVAYVSSAEEVWLRETGLTFRIDAERSNTPATIPGYPCYRTVAELDAQLAQWAADYPELTELSTIGTSYEGRPLRVLRVTNLTRTHTKPVFFLIATIHGRELITPETAMVFIETLLEGYDSDPDLTWLLDEHDIYVLPSANPDGHVKNEPGQPWAYWRKNTHPYGSCGSTGYGVDLNRNSSFHWGGPGASTDPCYDTYRGPSAASESETQAVQNFILTLFPDQRGPADTDPAPDDATGVFVTLHSYSNLVLWPWGDTYTDAPNGPQLRMLGERMAYFNNYTPQQSSDLYPTSGATDDFAYGELGIAAYTFEIGSSSDGFYPSCSRYDALVNPNIDALLYAAKSARTPYLTSFGPEVINLALDVDEVLGGEPVELTATVDDTRRRGSSATQNIVAAAYYVDTPPWITATTPVSYPLAPADGSFDSKSEGVEALLDTTTWSAGRHTLYLQGQDADGLWGPVSAAFITVTHAADSAIVGSVQDTATNLPLPGVTVALSGGAFPQTTTTDPAGLYAFTVLSGTYDLTATAYGYAPTTVTGVRALSGVTTTQPLSLTTLPTGTLAGQVRAAGTLQPLEALVTAVSTYTTLQTTSDPATGAYALPAFSGSYTVTAVARGYDPASAQVDVQTNLTTTQDFTLQPKACLLLMDDDAGDETQALYQADLDALGVDYATWTVAADGSPTAAQLEEYRHVLWLTGRRYQQTLTTADQTALSAYLDQGGNLLLSSWGAGSDLAGSPFLADYLHATHHGDIGSGTLPLTGQGPLASHPLTLTASATLQVSRLTPGGGAAALYSLSAPYAEAAAIGYQGDYNLAYLGFGLEMVEDSAARRETLVTLLEELGPCADDFPPQAGFSSDSPVTLGEPVHFTNTTRLGTPATLTYTWNFGDGAGTATAEHPTYTYTAAGTYTVTLTATNAAGSDSF
ncbi:MAG: M14 family zinc carboxypeptidase, partial [Anaerolineales bacterium]